MLSINSSSSAFGNGIVSNVSSETDIIDIIIDTTEDILNGTGTRRNLFERLLQSG
jgi:hypothetical protein